MSDSLHLSDKQSANSLRKGMAQINLDNETHQGISEQDLQAHVAKLHVRFPEEYRAFLLKYNGGSPRPRCFKFRGSDNGSDVLAFFGFGSHYDISEELETYAGRLPGRFFPVATDSGGNLICISVAGDDCAKVYFWDHDQEAGRGEDPDAVDNITLIADGFDEFLNSLHELG